MPLLFTGTGLALVDACSTADDPTVAPTADSPVAGGCTTVSRPDHVRRASDRRTSVRGRLATMASYDDLSAAFLNCTLKRSPEPSPWPARAPG